MKKKLAMLLAATMLATLFTGCGAGGKEDKGELNLYTWDGMFPAGKIISYPLDEASPGYLSSALP